MRRKHDIHLLRVFSQDAVVSDASDCSLARPLGWAVFLFTNKRVTNEPYPVRTGRCEPPLRFFNFLHLRTVDPGRLQLGNCTEFPVHQSSACAAGSSQRSGRNRTWSGASAPAKLN